MWSQDTINQYCAFSAWRGQTGRVKETYREWENERQTYRDWGNEIEGARGREGGREGERQREGGGGRGRAHIETYLYHLTLVCQQAMKQYCIQLNQFHRSKQRNKQTNKQANTNSKNRVPGQACSADSVAKWIKRFLFNWPTDLVVGLLLMVALHLCRLQALPYYGVHFVLAVQVLIRAGLHCSLPSKSVTALSIVTQSDGIVVLFFFLVLFVCCFESQQLANCVSGTDLLRQLFVRPQGYRSYRSHPVTVFVCLLVA